ncbi:MAG: 50S ribosomal protein L23 [Deltaproteobacteria bacterium]|jgi:large subunit ribosomal protein L23|nr:50S ribosomal protein L23 [Deltaproteobacteria bacterium]|tara:strand:+ start:327 stop:617 length:291 start_codon:yes stop_codon:yes gene_type:complete
MAELHDVLIRPILTEKTTRLEAGENVYTFEVGVAANKHQIKEAVQSVFGVNVEDVRTMVVRGKSKRFGRYYGKRSNWKKAFVRLSDGDSLNFFESQ